MPRHRFGYRDPQRSGMATMQSRTCSTPGRRSRERLRVQRRATGPPGGTSCRCWLRTRAFAHFDPRESVLPVSPCCRTGAAGQTVGQIVRNLLEDIPFLGVRGHTFMSSAVASASAHPPASIPSSPSILRPTRAPTMVPTSIASSVERLLRCSTSSSPSASLYTASAAITRIWLASPKRSSSAMISPWKFGASVVSHVGSSEDYRCGRCRRLRKLSKTEGRQEDLSARRSRMTAFRPVWVPAAR